MLVPLGITVAIAWPVFFGPEPLCRRVAFGFKPASRVHIFLPLFFVYLFARSVRSWDTHRSSSNSQGHSCRDGSCRIRSFDDNTSTPKRCHVVEDVFPNGWDGGRAPRLDLWAAPTACRVSCVVCVGVIWRWWVGSVSFLPSKGQAEASGPMATAPFLNTCPWNRRTRRVGGVSLACVRWMGRLSPEWVGSPLPLSLHPPFWRGTRSIGLVAWSPFPFLSLDSTRSATSLFGARGLGGRPHPCQTEWRR